MQTLQKAKPGIGIDDFREIINLQTPSGYRAIYFDKSLMIQDIVNDSSKFLLFTRPRRFGKTLNMSMLTHFFGKSDSKNLFDNLDIAQYPEIIEKFQGKVPTIFITLKGVIGDNLEEMLQHFKFALANSFRPYRAILEKDFLELFDSKKCGKDDIKNCLHKYSEKLYNHYKTEVLILIDEYDTPLNTAYTENYLDETLKLFRAFFSETFKGNPYIYKGIITGISRIAKENIFSGLNNFKAYDIDSMHYTNYFGFTESEIDSLNLPENKRSEVREWYNGYNFGGTTIYNPWSILNYLSEDCKIAAYWSNTGGMSMIQKSLSPTYSEAMQKILNNEDVLVPIDHSLIFSWLHDNETAFMNLLYSAGYLTSSKRPSPNSREKYLRVTNKEVQEYLIYLTENWFATSHGYTFLKSLIKLFTIGDALGIQEAMQETILRTISFHDVTTKMQEAFYHGFMLGISLAAQDRYEIKSNRESGYGRYDIAWYPKNKDTDPGILIELKVDSSSAKKALKQIDTKKYEAELVSFGCEKIISYGIHCNGKKISVALKK